MRCARQSDKDISTIKHVATMLDYTTWPFHRLHSLYSGGANALALTGHSDAQIQRWADGEELYSKSTSVMNFLCSTLTMVPCGMSLQMQ